jgi:hypothetical protein
MFDTHRSGEAGPGERDEVDAPAAGRTPPPRETPDRYGDVPLGVECAWPAEAARITS